MSFLSVTDRAQFARVSCRARQVVFNSESLRITDEEIETIQASVRAQFPSLFIRPFTGPLLAQDGGWPCSRDVVRHTLNRLHLPTAQQVAAIIANDNPDAGNNLIHDDPINAAQVRRYRCVSVINTLLGLVLAISGMAILLWPLSAAKDPSASTVLSMTAAGITLMIISCCLIRMRDGHRPAGPPSCIHTLMGHCAIWSQRRGAMERMPLLADNNGPAAAV